jgi:hypothetical protein
LGIVAGEDGGLAGSPSDILKHRGTQGDEVELRLGAQAKIKLGKALAVASLPFPVAHAQPFGRGRALESPSGTVPGLIY